MDFDLDGFLLSERKCRVCGEVKDLIDGFYKTRKTRSDEKAYSYECKECTKRRTKTIKNRKNKTVEIFDYPDW